MSDLNLPKDICKLTYADDITLIPQNKDILKATNDLKSAIKNIKEWTDKWDLNINISKSKLMTRLLTAVLLTVNTNSC